MQSNLDLYIPLVYFLTALPYAWMGLYAWRKRPAVAVTPFAWMMLCMSVWALMYALEIAAPTLSLKIGALKTGHIAIASIPPLFLFFALEFTGRSHWLAQRGRFLLWVVPALTVFLIWTNEYHFLIWTTTSTHAVKYLSLLVVEYTPFFGAFTFFSLALIVVAIVLLFIEMRQRSADYQIQVALVFLSILTPLAGRLIHISNAEVIGELDISPILALPTCFIFFWAVTRQNRLLELLPLEYLTVLKNMKDGVIVVNENQRVIYLNPIAEELLERSEAEAIGQPLNYVSSIYGDKLLPYLNAGEYRVELTFSAGSQVFEVTVSPVTSLNISKNINGADRMIVLHDISHLKETENALVRRESIMSALSLAAQQFLKESTWEHNIPGVLEKIGQAADLSRIFVAMNYVDENHIIHASLCYEWANSAAGSQINNLLLKQVPLRKAGFKRWEKELAEGNPIFGLVKNFPESEHRLLTRFGSLALAVMPIFVNRQWWGFIAFDEIRYEREWTNTEIEALSIAASMFGSAEARARTEQKLIRRQNSMDLLQEIVLTSLKSEDLLAMSQALVEPFAHLIQADTCSLSLWDENNHQEIHLATYDRQQRAHPTLTTSPAERTFTEAVLYNGHTLVIENANAAFYEEHLITQTMSAASALALPLLAGKKKLGAILLTFDNLHHFQPEEISLSEQASNLVALALEKFQTVEQAERRATAAETLRKASAVVAETLETEEAIARILEQLKSVIAYDSASVQLLNENYLEIIGGSGFADMHAIIGVKFPIPGDNPNTRVMQTGEPYLLPEIDDLPEIDNDQQYFKKMPHHNIHSWLGIPLIFQERVIGLLAIDSFKPNHFKEQDIQLAAMFANQVAVTLENTRLFKETQDQAITDALTGVYNRRGLFQVGDYEFIRARDTSRPFSVMMLDIDHFKRVNDHYGHAAGDQALRALAERCRTNSRSVDVVCRYGGEEFVIFLPETNVETAHVIAERLRQTIMDTPFTTEAGPLRITISIGVTQANPNDSLKTLIERADNGLYSAKRMGRNRVVVNNGTTQPLPQI